MKRKAMIFACVGITLGFSIALATPATFALYEKSVGSIGSFGQISLRSYFERGIGTEDDPYVITRPRHMYNLSRLQSLGVFGEKKYFQLGLVGLGGASVDLGPLCYLSDTSSDKVPFLDMQGSNHEHEPINAIGTEAIPFYGEFNGQNLEIKNLQVYADPEDAGLFGYTAHGSLIENLFLDNITINALGYTDEYDNLYGASNTTASGVHFDYSFDGVERTFYVDTDSTIYGTFDGTDYFASESDSDLPEEMPFVTAHWPSTSQYKYNLLPSGDFVVVDGTSISVSAKVLFDFFKAKADALDASEFPLNASSSVSIIAYTIDSFGLDHAKSVMTLEFNFTMPSKSSALIEMEVRLGPEHGNNIGILIGHCDGSVNHCYVHSGAFNMNNNAGETITGDYNPLSNSSGYGLIGLTGGTVHDLSSEQSGAATSSGKDIGVLDFSTIYKDIVDESSFPANPAVSDGIQYAPLSTTKYGGWLRVDNQGHYITKNKDYVSFRGQSVIQNNDLGVFNITTDAATSGMEFAAGTNLDNSVVHDEGTDIDYLYYATGEYSKSNGISFDNYSTAMDSNTPQTFFPGYHFPRADQITVESFEEREARQNYIFRFQLQPDYRNNTNGNLYFADVDQETPGGSFLSKYFESKLVDQDAQPIPAGQSKCGVMLRNVRGREIGSFRCSFKTPDLSTEGMKMLCLDDSFDPPYPVANTINFQIKSEVANVTVVAAPANSSKSAAVGVYNTQKDSHPTTDLGYHYINTNFNDPDYAFFMPKDSHLAYFDYQTDENDVGQIGNYASSSATSITPADTHTDATIATSEAKTIAGKPRLFVHTFKLRKGRYCLGSPTGADKNDQTVAKIYYVCAQGQNDGQLEFENNVFASSDKVDNLDFIKTARFTYNDSTKVTTENILVGEPDAIYSSGSKILQHQRCYLSFVKTDKTIFKKQEGDIAFNYEDDTFTVTSTTSECIERLAITNYGRVHVDDLGLGNTYISVLGEDRDNSDKITYP